MSSEPATILKNRRRPIGAETLSQGGVHFRVWAPRSPRVTVRLETESDGATDIELQAEPDGYFSGLIPDAKAGMTYRYVLERGTFPDPVSRFQPQGPHEASQIVDPLAFQWTDRDWKGVTREGQVIYEFHLGTFTKEGTWRAAIEQLEELAQLGVTLLEVMPVADFPGRYGWGYDGVSLFAPTRLYGEPDDFRAFVDRAHALGLGVILDVVYNHFGPDGNYLTEFSEDYLSKTRHSEWGAAVNFDGENSAPVREFILANAGYWIEEFHLDGLRLDATQQFFDGSEDHIIAAIAREVRRSANGRGVYVVGENEPQDSRLIRDPAKGGYGLEALWNDDFHHSAIVALTGRNEAYYTDYRGTPQEFVSTAKRGFLYQGQRYRWQKGRRGSASLDLEPSNFVTFVQNHDQVANSLWGHRLHTMTDAGRLRAITALLLLGPGTPLLFQGQEFAASTPFLYFADHNPDLAKLVAEGRAKFLRQFPSIDSPEAAAMLANPEEEETFLRCKLDFADREKNRGIYLLHKELIALRHRDPLLGRAASGTFDGAVLSDRAFVLRYFGREQNDRLLVVNFGTGMSFDPVSEPLLGPPSDRVWETIFSTEDPRYGGGGRTPLEAEDGGWTIPAHAAALLAPKSFNTNDEK
jgi:maltooligosyltrehalose trehalohydrolase